MVLLIFKIIEIIMYEWKLSHQSGRKIAVDLFFVGRTDKVEAMAVSRKI